jgi:hypothetical protein
MFGKIITREFVQSLTGLRDITAEEREKFSEHKYYEAWEELPSPQITTKDDYTIIVEHEAVSVFNTETAELLDEVSCWVKMGLK